MRAITALTRPRLVATTTVAMLCGLIGVAAPLAAQADTMPPDPTMPTTVSADPLPTVQIDNGVVWSQVVVGNTVYAAGDFQNARPAGASKGTNLTARSNLLAYDITTGNLITSFAPTLNGQALVVAASPDGSRLYVGGDFTSVNGQTRSRIASFNTATGALTTFKPLASTQVRAIHATNSTVYFGGNFTQVNGVARKYVAAADANTGALLNWDPSADAPVNAMTLNYDKSKLIIGGRFQNMGGAPQYGLSAVDPSTGAVLPWSTTNVVRDAGTAAAITSLSSDAKGVYGSGYVFGAGGNLEGSFRADNATGDIQWLEDCHGDTVSTFPTANVVYAVGHPHYCGNIGGYPQTDPWTMHHSLAFSNKATGTVTGPDPYGYYNFAGQPAPSLLNWFPDWSGAGSYTSQGQAGWNVTGNSNYVVVGGEFTAVNNGAQQGLVRFAVPSIAPNKVGPNSNDGLTPSVSSYRAGTARVAWQATYDRDNEAITYKVFRNFKSLSDTPVYQTKVNSTFWKRPGLSFTDTTATPGATYNYRVYAFDPYGNYVARGATTVTVATTANEATYAAGVLDDNPSSYFRLDEASGTTVKDIAGADNAVAASGVTRGATGALTTQANAASSFDGTPNGFASTQIAKTGPSTFSAEAWIKTNTTQGGKILGFGGSKTGTSGNYDRHVYMDNTGHIVFGVYPGGVRTVSSPKTYNDGQYHHVVASLSGAGMALYVDGERVAADPGTTSAQQYSGYWRIGGDNLNGWSNQPSSNFFNGTIDEVAIYPTALTAGQVQRHYVNGGGSVPNVNPISAFSSTVNQLAASFDGSGSSDSDGTVASYAWDFGDGATSALSKPTHSYAAAGTYTVTLTVTDDKGATDSVSHTVTAVDPPANAKPAAAFTSTVSQLAASFDGSGSSDSDGTVASYAWDFGDGATSTLVKPNHTYAAAGTYSVTLTVADDKGLTDAVTKPVTVDAAPAVLAQDAFARTVSGGFGTADTGGAWTVSGGASNFSVGSGKGTMVLSAPSASRGAYLPIASADNDVHATVSLDKPATGGGVYAAVVARGTSTNGYRGKLKVASNGALSVSIARVVSGTETTIGTANLTGSLSVGETLHLRMQAVGAAPTAVKLRVWKDGTTEPTAWQVDVTDTTASLQSGTGIGLWSFLSGTATNAPVAVSFDDLSVRAITA